MLLCIFDFCSFCHNPNRQTVECTFEVNERTKQFFPKEKYIAIRECKTKILSTVENPLLNPVCAPEISSTSTQLGVIKQYITYRLKIFKFYFINEMRIKNPIKIKRILTNKTCSE